MLIEVAKGTITNRGYIMETQQLNQFINDKDELYKSYFGFDDKIKEHINSGRKSPSGFIGTFYLPLLILVLP